MAVVKNKTVLSKLKKAGIDVKIAEAFDDSLGVTTFNMYLNVSDLQSLMSLQLDLEGKVYSFSRIHNGEKDCLEIWFKP